MNKQLPTTADAEQWIDPDTFIFQGFIYKLTQDGKVKRIGKANEPAK